MLEALERRDVVAIGELLADDAVYHFPGRGPVAGTYRGRDAVLGMFRTLVGLFDGPPEMSSHDVVASEAHVVDLATYIGVRGGQSFTWNASALPRRRRPHRRDLADDRRRLRFDVVVE